MPSTLMLDARARTVVEAIQDGLPLVAHPYREIAARLGMEEDAVIDVIRGLREQGVISRFGVVVRHRELGYRANAMVVWDVPDGEVALCGEAMRAYPFVSLCYERPRVVPHWNYNLFCMIHGHDRRAVLGQLRGMTSELALHYPHAVLFSRRRFKQRGARYVLPPVVGAAAGEGG